MTLEISRARCRPVGRSTERNPRSPGQRSAHAKKRSKRLVLWSVAQFRSPADKPRETATRDLSTGRRARWCRPRGAPGKRGRSNGRCRGGKRSVCVTSRIRPSSCSTTSPRPPSWGNCPCPCSCLGSIRAWGQSERVLPPSALDYFRRHLPLQTLIEEPTGFGHSPHIDDPARLAAWIVDFTGYAVQTSSKASSKDARAT
jgi:hypothetical protein